MVSMMVNNKRYIFLMLKNQAWPPWASPQKALEWWLHSFFSFPSPSLRGKLKMNRVEGGRKNPEGKAALGGKEGGAAGKWLGLGPLKQEEVSLPCWPPPSGLLSGHWLQFCSPWHSFPVESRSGLPSPEGLSEMSFSIPLTPMRVNTYRKSRGTLKAQKPEDVIVLVGGRRDGDPPLRSHYVFLPVPTDWGRRTEEVCWQRAFNQDGLGSIEWV